MTYPIEFKEAVLDKIFNSDLSFRQISEEMGIPRATLHGWKKRYMMKEDPDALKPLPENWSAEEGAEQMEVLPMRHQPQTGH